MLPKISFKQTPSYNKLKEYFDRQKGVSIASLFEQDTNRFQKFSVELDEVLLFDYSKNNITEESKNLLISIARECELERAVEAMFNGEKINETENRAVLHTALRYFGDDAILVDGDDVMPDVRRVLVQVKKFSENLLNGNWRGYTHKAITDIVNIGIGGSDLGPSMAYEALKPYKKHINAHFVSNADGSHIAEVLKKVNPETTLFIVASKTFTTRETMLNAQTAKQWFLASGASQKDVAKHFVALSTNKEEVEKFGISVDNMFEFWDWVGGRYSLWSAVGLSLACSVGYDNFEEMLKGAYEADCHFRNTPFERNIPVLMALIGLWNINFLGYRSHALLPYNQYLNRFVAYFQQGDMESNGKSVDRNGNKVDYNTGPIIWGEPGTNGQHAFYQSIHQGTSIVPADFIVSAKTHNPLSIHHQLLISNFFAQTEALMSGKPKEQAQEECSDCSHVQRALLASYRTFEGNRPTNSILLKELNPFTFGALTAIYEHKIFTQGILWNIYSFDQFGVELGKTLANKILSELEDNQPVSTHDGSTNGLINKYKQWR